MRLFTLVDTDFFAHQLNGKLRPNYCILEFIQQVANTVQLLWWLLVMFIILFLILLFVSQTIMWFLFHHSSCTGNVICKPTAPDTFELKTNIFRHKFVTSQTDILIKHE